MTPKFFMVSNEEKAGWRTHPVTKAFIEYLDTLEAQVADECLGHVGNDRMDDARRASAILTAIQALHGAINREQNVIADATDSTFVDPAAIWEKVRP